MIELFLVLGLILNVFLALEFIKMFIWEGGTYRYPLTEDRFLFLLEEGNSRLGDGLTNINRKAILSKWNSLSPTKKQKILTEAIRFK